VPGNAEQKQVYKAAIPVMFDIDGVPLRQLQACNSPHKVVLDNSSPRTVELGIEVRDNLVQQKVPIPL